MSSVPSRRGFLRDLAGLPLVGGGVTIIGNPTAAAEPITPKLLDSYETWLEREKTWLRWHRYGRDYGQSPLAPDWEIVFHNRQTGDVMDVMRVNNAAGRFWHDRPGPETRAAIVLSAVGCKWRENRS